MSFPVVRIGQFGQQNANFRIGHEILDGLIIALPWNALIVYIDSDRVISIWVIGRTNQNKPCLNTADFW